MPFLNLLIYLYLCKIYAWKFRLNIPLHIRVTRSQQSWQGARKRWENSQEWGKNGHTRLDRQPGHFAFQIDIWTRSNFGSRVLICLLGWTTKYNESYWPLWPATALDNIGWRIEYDAKEKDTAYADIFRWTGHFLARCPTNSVSET